MVSRTPQVLDQYTNSIALRQRIFLFFRFHGLSGDEIHGLAGNLFNITQKLKMAQRTLFKLVDGTVVGASPQTYCNNPDVRFIYRSLP